MPTPDRRVVINELVCEGCGDCNVQSNCLSVMALETEFGRKRRINQSSCNQDFSCLNGFCPSFVTLKGAKRNPPRPLAATALPSLPEPRQAALDGVHNVLIAGVGGTGVVTASGLLGLAAHLEGKAVLQLDQTGLAQKYGAVLSHVRIAAEPERLHGMRIPAGQVDLLLGADLIVAAGKEPLVDAVGRAVGESSSTRTRKCRRISSAIATSRFPGRRCSARCAAAGRAGAVATLDATRLASALLGDSIGANVLMLGFAFQRGLLPVSGAALYRALELYGRNVEENKLAFDWGRFTAQSPEQVERLAYREGGEQPSSTSLPDDDRAARRVSHRLSGSRLRGALSRALGARRGGGAARSARQPSAARAVARNYFSVLAYKDEYEVARLHTESGFVDSVRAQFRRGRAYELSFLAAAARAASTPPRAGRKNTSSAHGCCRSCACSRNCVGCAARKLDPFGWSADRRLERELLARYEALLDRIIAELDDSRSTWRSRWRACPSRCAVTVRSSARRRSAPRGRAGSSGSTGRRPARSERALARRPERRRLNSACC